MKRFDKVYKHYNKFIDLFNLNKMGEIKDVLKLQGDETVLDIGGGTGRLADYISEDCRLVYVLDESEGMLSEVETNAKVVTVLGNALDTNFDNNSIDIVILSDVLHHIKEQVLLIDEIYRILGNNGKLVILDFEKSHMKIMILRIFEYILFGKLYFRTSKEVNDLIKDKFIITKSIHKGYYFIIKGEKNA